VSSAAGTSAASSAVSEDGRQLQDDLRSTLKNQIGSDANGIAVAVDATSIRLSGSVASRDEKDKAIEVAQSRAGSRQVDASDLKVK
jgi:osmotically-inducible protein OsmY